MNDVDNHHAFQMTKYHALSRLVREAITDMDKKIGHVFF